MGLFKVYDRESSGGFVIFVSLVLPLHADILCLLPETFEFSKAIASGPISKSSSKVRKSASNGPGDCIPLHGSQAVSSVCFYLLELISI